MIIKLNGADFSKNNLGQIQFRRELTAETLNILSKYTKVLSDEQKFAFQDFLNGLKANGIWDKIGVMYMPILSSKLSECVLNLKDLTQCTVPTTTSLYKIEGGYCKFTQSNGQINTTDAIQIKVNGSNMNVHFLLYADATVDYADGHNVITNKVTTSDSTILSYTIGKTYNATYKLGKNTKNSISPITTKGLIGFSSGTDTFLSFEDSVKQVVGVCADDTTITNAICYLNRRDTSWATPVNIDWSILSTGTALTLTEGQKYKELVDTLVSKISS